MTKRKAWNKGLKKGDHPSIDKFANTIRRNYAEGKVDLTSKRSEKFRKTMSDHAKRRGLGGYNPHPNKGTWYKDIWFDSSWEVKLAKSMDDNQVRWTRPSEGFVWNDEGKIYYPDFYLIDYDVYLEPKNNYLQKIDKEKINESIRRNNIQVIVLGENELEWNVVKNLLP